MSKIIKIGQLFLNLQPIMWVDVFFWNTVYFILHQMQQTRNRRN